MNKWIKVFAPGTVANIGPGFDILGFAVEGIGDVVEARKIPEPIVKIREITGDNKGRLPKDAERNTAAIAASEVLKLLKFDGGMEIKLHKGLSLGSGLGSSGASAAAGALAANALFGNKLTKNQLIEPCLKAEASVSGYHADNVAPALLGGFVLIRRYSPLDVISLGSVDDLFCALLIPELELPTRNSREVLPEKISLEDAVHNSSCSCAIVAGVLKKDMELIGRSIDDKIVEPSRASLIPGFYEVKKAALKEGALGCSISGAGPSIFALASSRSKAMEVGISMQLAFEKRGKLKSRIHVCNVDKKGTRIIE